jgi:hypothetical protein
MLHVFVIPIGALGLLVLSWFLGYAAHVFFVVLSGTAQGKNEVEIHWPSEPYAQRLCNAAYLLTLLAMCLVPAGLLLLLVELPAEPALRAALVALLLGAALWLFLPVVLLSVVSSSSHWDVFRWSVVRELASHGTTLLAFYALSAPLVIGGVLVIYLALIGWLELVDAAGAAAWTWLPEAVTLWSWAFLLPVTAVFAAAALLIYARLLGRLAWLLDLASEEPATKPKDSTPSPGHFAIYGEPNSAEPAVLTGLEKEETYEFRDDPCPAGDLAPVSVDPVRLAVLGRQKTEPLSPEPAPVERLPSLPPPQDPLEKDKASRLWVRGIYRYPWYGCSLKAWLFLTLVSLFLLVLFRAQLLAFI